MQEIREVLIDALFGNNIPVIFARQHAHKFHGIEESALEDLKSDDPDVSSEAWEEILECAFFIDDDMNKWTLEQDQDLFVVMEQ